MITAIIYKDTGRCGHTYSGAPCQEKHAGDWGDKDMTVHVPVPESVYDIVKDSHGNVPHVLVEGELKDVNWEVVVAQHWTADARL